MKFHRSTLTDERSGQWRFSMRKALNAAGIRLRKPSARLGPRARGPEKTLARAGPRRNLQIVTRLPTDQTHPPVCGLS